MKSNYKLYSINLMTLVKVLTFWDVFWAGLGYIVGAGIYSLLNITTKYSGNYTWLSFIIGGFISMMTGLSYADLSQKYDSNAAEYDYITKTISDKAKHLIGLILITLGIFTAATLMIAFSNYLVKLNKNIPYLAILVILTLITTTINIIGVKTTTNTNMIISIVESLTLVVLIFLSSNKINITQLNGEFNYNGIVQGAFITIFTYKGFEAISKLAEETKNSKKNIPKAIIASLAISILLYTFTSISVNSILGTNNVKKTVSALADTYKIILGNNSYNIVNVIGLFSIFNTVLLTILFTSRQLYGISEEILPKNISKILRHVNIKTKTPIYSILFVAVSSFIISNIKNVEKTTVITNTIQFILFSLVNLAALILRYKDKHNKNNYYIKKPIHSVLGLLSSIYMIYSSITHKYIN